MKASEYIAVFKSLSYAGRAKNEFHFANRPKLIKTPKGILGGCSYSLIFSEEQLPFMISVAKKYKKGFIGLYKTNLSGSYEVIDYDLSG